MTGKVVGYARTSTLDQVAGLEDQIRQLKAAGVEKLYTEQISSVADRPALESMIDFIREGDTVIVTKIDRLARSVADLVAIMGRIETKGASLRFLDLGMETKGAMGNLLVQILGAVAEFERRLMLERQKVGIAKAKREGKYKGRAPTVRAKTAAIESLLAQGLGPSDIAAKLNVARSSVYRVANAMIREQREHREAIMRECLEHGEPIAD